MTLESIRSAPVVSDTDEALTDLQRALLRACALILDADRVREYQAEKLYQARKLERAARDKGPWLKGWWSRPLFLRSMFRAVDVAAAAGLTWCMRDTLAKLPDPILAWGAGAAFFGAALATVALLMATVIDLLGKLHHLRRPRKATWSVTTVGRCAGRRLLMSGYFRALGPYTEVTPIPEEARAVCDRVALAGAEGELVVEQLDDDPFLFIQHGFERYCIFAWDEKGYVPR